MGLTSAQSTQRWNCVMAWQTGNPQHPSICSFRSRYFVCHDRWEAKVDQLGLPSEEWSLSLFLFRPTFSICHLLKHVEIGYHIVRGGELVQQMQGLLVGFWKAAGERRGAGVQLVGLLQAPVLFFCCWRFVSCGEGGVMLRPVFSTSVGLAL